MTNRSPISLRPVTPVDCAGCPAQHLGLFGRLDPAERTKLLGSFRIADYSTHGTIYRTGEPGDYVFIIHFGLIKLLRYSSSGAERIVQLARSGDTIGLAALTQVPYRRTAIAMTNCEVCRVPATVVRDYNQHHPEFMATLLDRYQASVEMGDTFLTELSTGTAHQRLARLLLFLAEQHDHNEAPLLTRDEMGALLGITTETASRITAEFRREGLIDMLNADRCRCNIEALQAIALGT
jgi:CRP-like cAMP-binding protein